MEQIRCRNERCGSINTTTHDETGAMGRVTTTMGICRDCGATWAISTSHRCARPNSELRAKKN